MLWGAPRIILAVCLIVMLIDASMAQRPIRRRGGSPREGRGGSRGKAPTFTATLDMDSSHFSTDKRFLSVALGASMCSRLKQFKINKERFRAKLMNLAKEFSPAVVRIGGIKGNFNIINPDNRTLPVTTGEVETWEEMFHENFWTGEVGKSDWSNINCTGEDIVSLFSFFDEAGWSIMYQVNHMLRDEHDVWDPYNTNLLLNLLDNHGINVEYFQLTNEPNAYSGNLGLENNEEKVVHDFAVFRHYLANDAPERFQTAKVVGPDVSSRHHGKNSYLWRVMQAGLGQHLDALGVHHYYEDGRTATIEDFLNSTMYDLILRTTDNAHLSITDQPYPMPLYLTETASAFAGGARELSNRYLDSLIWLDELGMSAKNRVSRLNRQNFWAGQYALIDFKTYDPNPSYYVSAVYKRLVEGAVINVTVSPEGREVRVYAHCAKTDSIYDIPDGAVVVYIVNLLDVEVGLNLEQFGGHDFDVFLFTKIEGKSDEEAFRSPTILLNGHPLEMSGDDLPFLPPASQPGPKVKVAAHSTGFVLVRDAHATLCHQD